jgi:general secretion pathway protein E
MSPASALDRAHLARALGIDGRELSEAEAARAQGESLARALIRLKLATEEAAAAAFAEASGLPLIKAEHFQRPPPRLDALNPQFLERADAALVRLDEDGALVAIAEPAGLSILEGVRLAAGRAVRAGIARLSLIDSARTNLRVDASAGGEAEAEDETAGALSEDGRDAPIVRLVEDFISGAVRARASDLHIEPYPDRVRVRVRVDGVLRDWRTAPARLARMIASRVKIIAGLDIAERRLPQDGRAKTEVDGVRYDLRVAAMPSAHGETVVIRFLVNENADVRLDGLGMSGTDLARLTRVLTQPHGMILVVGPTGGGKTTTLAASLSSLNSPTRKLISIEDPVEYLIDGVTQVAVRPAIGLTFAQTLRALLRNDPDVIVIGELRDRETAEIAANAALTGHLVLATLHANDAAGAAPRLIEMGVDASTLRSTLKLVIAQRLVRQLCPHCRRETESGWEAVGCAACDGTGYKGRTGIFELFEVDPANAGLIRGGAAAIDFIDEAKRRGWTDLRADAEAKAGAGITTGAEVIRVLGL